MVVMVMGRDIHRQDVLGVMESAGDASDLITSCRDEANAGKVYWRRTLAKVERELALAERTLYRVISLSYIYHGALVQ